MYICMYKEACVCVLHADADHNSLSRSPFNGQLVAQLMTGAGMLTELGDRFGDMVQRIAITMSDVCNKGSRCASGEQRPFDSG
jgi:hypothetical protein